jgi:DNA-3-methyladenine glycosylase I
MSELVVGADGLARCAWGASSPEYLEYHDYEWGRPVGDESRVYEKLCLEGFQSGLSWQTAH